MSISSIPESAIEYKNSDEKFLEELGTVYHIPVPHEAETPGYYLDYDNVVVGTGEILFDPKGNGKERPWKRHKQGNVILHDIIYPLAREVDPFCITDTAYAALGICGNYLLFKRYTKTQIIKLEKAYFCRNRLCPTCNWRKSLKLYSQMQEVSAVLMDEFKTARYLFATFTLKNVYGAEIENTINAMNKGFKSLVNTGKNRTSTKKFKENLLGYAKAMEIKYDSEKYVTPEMYEQSKKYYSSRGLKIGSLNPNCDKYHPHFHALFMVKAGYFSHGYISQAKWAEIWKDCMHLDYTPVVDVRVIKPNEKRLDNGAAIDLEWKNEVAMGSAISEVMKYPVKPDSLKIAEFENLDESQKERIVKAVALFSKVLFRRRLVTFGGEILKMRKKLGQDDIEDGSLIHVDDEPAVEGEFELVLYKWMKMGAYIC